MPPGFGFPRGAELPTGLQFGARTELWTPLVFAEADRTNYRTQNLSAIARLKSGVSPAQLYGAVSSQLKAFLAANAPKLDLDYNVLSLQQQAGQGVRRGLLLLMAAVALLLFIACANVTNLLIARTGARRREFAVRAALGAGRVRIARQLITENVLLAFCGTALGIAVSIWATRAMLHLVPGSLPRADDIGVDWRVSAAAGAITLVVGVAFGIAATTQVKWEKLANTLREEGARTTGTRGGAFGRRSLVIAEVALSLMLVIAAALLTMSFVRLQRVDPGFDPSNTLTARVVLPLPGAFNPGRDGPVWAQFFRQLHDRVAQLPGVKSAGAVSALPLTGSAEGGGTAIVGEPPPEPGQGPHAQYLVVEGDFFQTMGIRIDGGRVFTASDVSTSVPVAVVNREYARKYLHGQAIGRQIRAYFDFSVGATPRTIVGIVNDVQYGSLDSPVVPQVYVPEQQMPYPGLEVVIRTSGDPMSVLSALKRETKALDPRLAVSNPRTVDDAFEESLARRRFSMTLIGVFAVSAVVLAMVGLYGVIAVSVGQRRREIGVRMALGARPSDVLRLVLGEGMRITFAGVVVGLIGAYAASRLVASLLYGTSATNMAVYATASVTIVLVTLAATYIPALRATRVDPTSALR
jgi:putative ABC transport system permease protein